MGFGVHGVHVALPSLSGVAFMASNWTSVYQFGHQNGHQEGKI